MDPLHSRRVPAGEKLALFRRGIGASALLASHRPDVVNVTFQRPYVLRMARPKPKLAWGPLVSSFTRQPFRLSIFEYRPFVRLEPIEQPMPDLAVEVTPSSGKRGLHSPESVEAVGSAMRTRLGFPRSRL